MMQRVASKAFTSRKIAALEQTKRPANHKQIDVSRQLGRCGPFISRFRIDRSTISANRKLLFVFACGWERDERESDSEII